MKEIVSKNVYCDLLLSYVPQMKRAWQYG